jgi:dUTPase
MYDTVVEIKWLSLEHCPVGQLSKPKDPTDAGYDLMVADDMYVPTISELDAEGAWEWEDVADLTSFPDHIQYKIALASELNDFKVDTNGMVMRKKYKFPLARTGVCIKPETMMWNAIYSRSGTATKYNVTLANAVGVIDYTYSGPSDELRLSLYAIHTPMIFKKGERVAQLVPTAQVRTMITRVEDPEYFTGPVRGGFGSTGMM